MISLVALVIYPDCNEVKQGDRLTITNVSGNYLIDGVNVSKAG